MILSIVLRHGKMNLDFRTGREAWDEVYRVVFANLIGAFRMTRKK
ncbi:hypothetical protein [Leptospira gomenensis]|nr:hypothetical protein [Leptospira gomenensis]